MTDLISAFLPLTSTSTTKSGLLDSYNKLATQSSASSFDLLLSSVNTDNTAKKKDSSTNAANSGDPMMNFLQNMIMSMDESLGNILAPSDVAKNYVSSLDNSNTAYGIDPSTASPEVSGFDYNSFVNGSGPLPDYLRALDKGLNLSTEQSQKLRDIAWENRDIVKTPDSVSKLGAELQQAGIG